MSELKWPVTIYRCLECGAVSGRGEHVEGWATLCSDGDYVHGPVQSILVQPAAGQDG